MDLDELITVLWVLESGSNLTAERAAKVASNNYQLLGLARAEVIKRRNGIDTYDGGPDDQEMWKRYDRIAGVLTQAVAVALDNS